MLTVVPGTRIVYVSRDPGIPPGMEGDALAGLPLVEGKAIGTASMSGNVNERDKIMRHLPAQQVQNAIRAAARNAPRALQVVYEEHRAGLYQVVDELIAGDISKREAQIVSAKLFRESYEKVREIARRAAALDELAHETHIYTEEEKWFRTAVREEIGYFHSFLNDVLANRARDRPERIEAYVRALRFMYEAARVQAMPDNVLLYWTGPRKAQDPKVCEGCEYMMERSPFPKDLIPAVPRDGLTQCLTNCRHHILVRVVRNLNEVVRRRHALGKRESMVKQLKTLKEQAGLGRSAPRRTAAARDPFRGSKLQRRVASRGRNR